MHYSVIEAFRPILLIVTVVLFPFGASGQQAAFDEPDFQVTADLGVATTCGQSSTHTISADLDVSNAADPVSAAITVMLPDGAVRRREVAALNGPLRVSAGRIDITTSALVIVSAEDADGAISA